MGKINSHYIIDILLNNLRHKRKLNIVKYNKEILFRINITEEDFKIYLHLKEFNTKFNLNIEDIDVPELCLKHKRLGNEGLKYLSKIKFKGLKLLDLRLISFKNVDVRGIDFRGTNASINPREVYNMDLSGCKFDDKNITDWIDYDGVNITNTILNDLDNILA